HDRPADARPGRVAAARVVVAGMSGTADQPPTFPAGSEHVYRRYPLLRATALVVEAAAGEGWSVPAQVPELVRRGYGTDPIGPVAWQADMTAALGDWRGERERRQAAADRFVLAGPGELH